MVSSVPISQYISFNLHSCILCMHRVIWFLSIVWTLEIGWSLRICICKICKCYVCVYTCTGIHAFMSNVHTNVYISSIPMLWAWQIPLLTAIFWSVSPPKEWLFWWRVRCGTNRMGACTDVSWTEENFTSVEFLIIEVPSYPGYPIHKMGYKYSL